MKDQAQTEGFLKERETKADGRYVLYYTFGREGTEREAEHGQSDAPATEEGHSNV